MMAGRRPLGVAAMGLVTPLGSGADAVARALFEGSRAGIVSREDLCPGRPVWVGHVTDSLPTSPSVAADYDSRNNRMMLGALEQIRSDIDDAIRRHGSTRVGIVLGTSTGGMSDQEDARRHKADAGSWPAGATYRQWEMGGLAEYAALTLGIAGPAYVIATACSASAKVFTSGRRLIESGICDAVVVGGADTLCRLTASGFSSLEAVASESCNPFSRNRGGINIGEGAAAFLMVRGEAPVQFLGSGECSDAHHISAPHPEGRGARQAMSLALEDADLAPADVAYINLHGTGTPLNDAMEAKAIASLFGLSTPCSSTKAMIGHALGAAGACEAAFLWLTLNPAFNPHGYLPPHLWDGARDEALPVLHLVEPHERYEMRDGHAAMLSNSFAFGGNNVVLAFGRGYKS